MLAQLQIALASLSLIVNSPVMAQEIKPVVPVAEVISTSTIPIIISKYASLYGANAEELTRVMMCESSGNPDAINLADPNGGSKGLFQFQPATYAMWAKELGETRDIWNIEAQIRVAAYAFSKGRQGHWSCANMLKNKDI